jgi:indoleacetamide hydrolase
MAELWELGVAEAAKAIRDGEIKAEHLAESLVSRTKLLQPLNAFISFDGDAVLEKARSADRQRKRDEIGGRLAGVPLSFKDNIDVAGMPTTGGTPALRNHRPVKDAPVAAALFGEGAIAFGKNTMHELAFGITCNSPVFGAARNPYDTRMIPGGSSGGTAVAVAARMSPGGIGSDTGGSVRVPAALCGLVGLRPTLKRWSQKGIVPISSTRDTAGPLARKIEDLALLDSVVTGNMDESNFPGVRGLRIGVPRHYFWEQLDEETEKKCRIVLDVLKDKGAVLVQADLNDIAALNEAVSFVVALYEPRLDLRAYLRDSKAGVTFEQVVSSVASADVRATMQAMLDPASQVPDDVYKRVIEYHRPQLIERFADYFASNRLDAMIFPTTPLPARPIGDDETVELGGGRVPTFPTFIRNTDPGSNAGLPGVTVPVGLSDRGLPIGIALDGPPGADRRLLAIAGILEEALPRMAPPELSAFLKAPAALTAD